MTDCIIRAFRPSDTGALVNLINASNAADNIASRTSVGHFRAMAGTGDVDPEHDYWVAEAGGHLAGCSTVYREQHTRIVLRLWCHPDWRRSEIGRQMVLHNLEHVRGFPESLLDIPVRPAETDKLEMVQALGFHHERSWWRLRMDIPQRLPESPVPAGFTLRTFVAGQDERPLTDLVNECFAQHWGEGAHTIEEIEHDVHLSWFDPGLLVFAEADGRMAGYVWSWINPDTIALTGDTRGTVGDLGVIATYRRRGLGKALLLRALADLQTRGMIAAELDMDGPNVNARRLYESVGFHEKEETRWFRKELHRE